METVQSVRSGSARLPALADWLGFVGSYDCTRFRLGDVSELRKDARFLCGM